MYSIRIILQKENQKQKVKYISKTIGGDIKSFRSPVSNLILNFKRGGTLNIHAIRDYAIGGVFNKYVVGQAVTQNDTQKIEVPLDKHALIGYPYIRKAK